MSILKWSVTYRALSTNLPIRLLHRLVEVVDTTGDRRVNAHFPGGAWTTVHHSCTSKWLMSMSWSGTPTPGLLATTHHVRTLRRHVSTLDRTPEYRSVLLVYTCLLRMWYFSQVSVCVHVPLTEHNRPNLPVGVSRLVECFV